MAKRMASKKSKKVLGELRFAVKMAVKEAGIDFKPMNTYTWIGHDENINLLKDMLAYCNTYRREQQISCRLGVITIGDLNERLNINAKCREIIEMRIETLKPLYR